jgi:hypothetical protein
LAPVQPARSVLDSIEHGATLGHRGTTPRPLTAGRRSYAFQLCGLIGHQLNLAVSVARFQKETLPLDVAQLAHPLTECVHIWIIGSRIPSRHPSNPSNLHNLLRLRHNRPSCRTANQAEEIPPLHARPQGSECGSLTAQLDT